MSETKNTEALAESLSNFVNNYDRSGNKVFVEYIVHRTHRSLQQSVFRLFYACIKEWSKCYEDHNYDPRNENTCRMCSEIVETMKDKDYLPLV